MLRFWVNIFLAMVLVTGIWACAPRSTPAPVVMGSSFTSSNASTIPAVANGGVVVQPGDTLYAISRYHQTALQTLIEANDLTEPFIIRPGQVLRLPGPSGTPLPVTGPDNLIASERLPPPRPSLAKTGAADKPAVMAVQINPGSADQTVRASLVATPATMQNPDSGEDQTSGISGADAEISQPPGPAPQPQQIEAGKKTAALPESSPAPVSAPVAEPVHTRFLWPAKGPILSDFGPKQNGLYNDGINIAMPPNGSVHAAGSGTVSYAGNGLRGYGNLLLIRHEGGWVTAYAHNAELLVGKGDRVARGQLIARAGRSGGVSQDQLHFEVRQGARAVNPKPLLAGG